MRGKSGSRESSHSIGNKQVHDEALHLEGRPQSVVRLYRHIEEFIRGLDRNAEKMPRAKTINFCRGKSIFCSVHLTKSGLRIWLPLKFAALPDPPAFVRDVSNIGHWGVGDVEVRVNGLEQMESAQALIQKSYEAVR